MRPDENDNGRSVIWTHGRDEKSLSLGGNYVQLCGKSTGKAFAPTNAHDP
jgi:hypothetical protein